MYVLICFGSKQNKTAMVMNKQGFSIYITGEIDEALAKCLSMALDETGKRISIRCRWEGGAVDE